VPHTAAWEHRFQQELVDYTHTHGDCKVSTQWSPNPQLGNWVKTQCDMKQMARISDEHAAQLDLIGFDWGREKWAPRAVAWEQLFQHLVHYKQTNGDCKAPQRYDASPYLGDWVMRQCRNKWKAMLGDEREAQLDSIGFDWGIQGIKYEKENYSPTDYKKKKGERKD
jgi:hypothetical protein